jgi:tetratricopeptide (TPR) repeat protein
MNAVVAIYEKSQTAAERLRQILLGHKISEESIHIVSVKSELFDLIYAKKVNLLFLDGSDEDPDLLAMFSYVNDYEFQEVSIYTVLFSSKVSESFLFEAFDKGLNYYASRPYRPKKIADILEAFSKYPGPYEQLIKNGKKCLVDKNTLYARRFFSLAATLKSPPLDAQCCLAKVDFLEKKNDEAIKRLQDVLEIDPGHEESLSDIFDMYTKLNMNYEAYHAGMRYISRYMPRPDQATELIRLSVKTDNFPDIFILKEKFSLLTKNDSHVLNYVGAGLYVAGKYYIKKNETEKAFECFEELKTFYKIYPKFLDAAVNVLEENNLYLKWSYLSGDKVEA